MLNDRGPAEEAARKGAAMANALDGLDFAAPYDTPLSDDPERIAAFLALIGSLKRRDHSEIDVQRFVEPAPGTLRQAMSARHHVVLGRRGSGKSSLLRKVEQELVLQGGPVAFVDLDVYKEQTFPNLVANILLDAYGQYHRCAERLPADKRDAVRNHLDAATVGLRKLIEAPDEAEAFARDASERKDDLTGKVRGRVWAWPFSLGGHVRKRGRDQSERRFELKYSSSKNDTVTRNIGLFRETFGLLVKAFGADAYLILDELYHIRLDEQPRLVGYFHSMFKGSRTWLKIGTVRHRSKFMRRDQDGRLIGIQLSQDADTINLDASFESFVQTRRFLTDILQGFAHEAGLELPNLATEIALVRVIQSSGGVARDFLTMFERAIAVCRERIARDQGTRHRRITADDAWDAAAAFNKDRRDEFSSDVNVNPPEQLIGAIDAIRDFCYGNGLNCFLFADREAGAERALIDELWDCKLLHTVRTAIRMDNLLYTAFMMDVSEQAADKDRRQIILDLSEGNVRARLTRQSLILTPAMLAT